MGPVASLGIAMMVNSLTPSRMGTIDSMRVWLKAGVAVLKVRGTSLPRARSRVAEAFLLDLGMGIGAPFIRTRCKEFFY